MPDSVDERIYLTHLLKSCVKSADSLALKLVAIKICEAIELVEAANIQQGEDDDGLRFSASAREP
ncbi:hypothetical protein SAMN02745824_0757 [Parasphingorhabdus marina DSM 22363]|uniref:Uncharacterized protein n=1 Tax=Parasphingorhabdus marina DSM 22363 TaxID=1123272 RepID=A0A1N6CQT2_9SPHN|nr:hypothetical protein [Parasphingorhabdus marina]SIN60856.1 hypothetical protein SAMN02745824_0757 [Parasphingorhabdus marina DSM 22363]